MTVAVARSPQQMPTTPTYRNRQTEAEESTREVRKSGRGRKKAKTQKTPFQPIWQNNPSMRNGAARTDTVSFSQQGKLAQLLEHLEERKEAVIEQKSQMVENTLARGGKMEDIEEPLQSLDEQLQALDQMMTDAISQNMLLQAEQHKPGKTEEDKKPAVDAGESDPEGKIQALAGLSAQMQVSQTLMKASGDTKATSRVASSEIKNDDFRLEARLYRRKADAAMGAEVSTPELQNIKAGRRAYAKQLRLLEQETAQQTARLTGAAAENLGEVQKSLAPPAEEKTAEEKTENENQDS